MFNDQDRSNKASVRSYKQQENISKISPKIQLAFSDLHHFLCGEGIFLGTVERMVPKGQGGVKG